MNRISRLEFERTYADLLAMRQARPTRIRSQLADWPTVYVGPRPRRSLWTRMGWIWSRFWRSTWLHPALFVLWLCFVVAFVNWLGGHLELGVR